MAGRKILFNIFRLLRELAITWREKTARDGPAGTAVFWDGRGIEG
jgi:hypothetical protein